MVIQHNLESMNARRIFGNVTNQMVKSQERLASGYKINRAADDVAGLSISEQMRRQVRGLNRASDNAEDGISLAQVADGALAEVQSMLHRLTELSIQAANDTLTQEDRLAVDEEVRQIKESINEIATGTRFNTKQLFPETGQSPASVSMNNVKKYDIRIDMANSAVTVEQLDAVDANSGVSAAAITPGTPGSELADRIANEYIPNAVQQIFDKFPSLQGSGTEIGLEVGYIDGASNTLAYARVSYTGGAANATPVSFLVKVDSSDFSDATLNGSAEEKERLESTIAHEIMHTVMQDKMTSEMVSGEFPTWFKEGAAQLAGGGFTTGWNDGLQSITDGLSSTNDNSKDAQIKQYLTNYDVDSRPYGHGYLATAYMGYLSKKNTSVSANVTGSDIASGMDRIFANIQAGQSFETAVTNATGKTPDEIAAAINNGENEAVEFVRQLSKNSEGGAGSVISASLGAGGASLLGSGASQATNYAVGGASLLGSGASQATNYAVDPDRMRVTSGGGKSLMLQISDMGNMGVEVQLFQMSTQALGIGNINTKTRTAASNALNDIQGALERVNKVRSYYGSIQNRLEHAISTIDNTSENTQASESRIRDTDMADEMVNYSKSQILSQTGQAMISQANDQKQGVMNLLQQ